MSSEAVALLARNLRQQGRACGSLGCPFYAALCEQLAADADAGGPVAAVLDRADAGDFLQAYALRLLAGLHRHVLAHPRGQLARHYPPHGDGDPVAAGRAARDLLRDPPTAVLDALAVPPQTNEVGRAPALMSGMLVVAAATGLPLRLREIGSSGGLNLRLDAYRYEHDGEGWGAPDSPVRFAGLWEGGAPPFARGAEIVERRGCDRDPVDVTTDDGARALLSYVWPEPVSRFARARAAIELARDRPVAIDAADARDWVPAQLAEHRAGTVLVLFHSIMWQYLAPETRDELTETITRAVADASTDAPVAWLRFEPDEPYQAVEVRVMLRHGDDPPVDRFLATTGFHGGPIHWRA